MSTEPSPLRGLLLLLVVDIGIGLWLKLHKPSALPLFIVVNAPTIGVTGFFWPLLPKDAKDRLGAAFAAALSAPLSAAILLAIGGTLFVLSLFFASVTVELLDSSTATNIHLVRGTQSAPDSQAMATAVSFRLNRLNAPRSEVLGIAPWGQRVWIYSPTHVLFRDTTLLPWFPVRVQYPADFAPMANLAVLPGAEIMARLRRRDLRLSLHESEGGAVLATELLDTSGTVIGFLRPGPIAAEDSARWHRRLDPANDPANQEFLALMLQRWLRASWVPAVRPLRQGDTLVWDVRSGTDTSRSVARGRVVLNGSLADLYLKF
ncbi:MAG: hypothetical protein ACRDQ2_14750 [Gaiellales bacterium]